jgi:transcription elongation factor Elf1
MVSERRFRFDCPACAARLEIDRTQRGRLATCQACGQTFPGPAFPDPGPRRAVPRPDYTYRCSCPFCMHETSASLRSAGRLRACEECGRDFVQPHSPWERWQRPVSRIFTRGDLRRSLHHLMLATFRVRLADHRLERRARRRFEFYCGACGHLQQARVWEIATQQRCAVCDAMMIVPCPPHRHRDADATACDGSALFCPRCGTRVEPADRSRRTRTRCPACRKWF